MIEKTAKKERFSATGSFILETNLLKRSETINLCAHFEFLQFVRKQSIKSGLINPHRLRTMCSSLPKTPSSRNKTIDVTLNPPYIRRDECLLKSCLHHFNSSFTRLMQNKRCVQMCRMCLPLMGVQKIMKCESHCSVDLSWITGTVVHVAAFKTWQNCCKQIAQLSLFSSDKQQAKVSKTRN